MGQRQKTWRFTFTIHCHYHWHNKLTSTSLKCSSDFLWNHFFIDAQSVSILYSSAPIYINMMTQKSWMPAQPKHWRKCIKIIFIESPIFIWRWSPSEWAVPVACPCQKWCRIPSIHIYLRKLCASILRFWLLEQTTAILSFLSDIVTFMKNVKMRKQF